jgi:DUF1009 family protein
MLRRLARRRSGGQPVRAGGVLVKRPKPGQDLRVDLPAIGPDTVRGACEARLAGLAVDAGAAIAARRRELVELANAAGVFVTGCGDGAGASGSSARQPRWSADAAVRACALCPLVGRRRDASLLDAAKGAAVIATLSPYEVGGAVVVARGHVLCVETGEGPAAAIARAAGLRQWGARGRRGVAVLARAADADVRAVAAAAEAGLAALVLAPGAAACAVPPDAREAARRHGLAIAALVPAEDARR